MQKTYCRTLILLLVLSITFQACLLKVKSNESKSRDSQADEQIAQNQALISNHSAEEKLKEPQPGFLQEPQASQS